MVLQAGKGGGAARAGGDVVECVSVGVCRGYANTSVIQKPPQLVFKPVQPTSPASQSSQSAQPSRPPEADGGAQDVVGDGECIHQGHRHPAQLAAQRSNQPLDGLGLQGQEGGAARGGIASVSG